METLTFITALFMTIIFGFFTIIAFFLMLQVGAHVFRKFRDKE
jgi:hypothetical protein